MSTTICEINKNNIETIKVAGKDREEFLNDSAIILDNPDMDRVIEAMKNDGLGEDNIIDEKLLNEYFQKLFGKDSDRLVLAGKIKALLEENPDLFPMFESYIYKRLPENVKVTEKQVVKDKSGKSRTIRNQTIDLSTFPKSSLVNIYAQVYGTVNRFSDGKKPYGSFGSKRLGSSFTVDLTTPGQLIYRDPSGAFNIMQKATRDYSDVVAQRIATFMTNPDLLDDDIKLLIYAKMLDKKVKDLNKKEIKIALNIGKAGSKILTDKSNTNPMGMDKISSELRHLAKETFLKEPNAADLMQNLFSMAMRGEISLKHLKEGKLMIHSDYRDVMMLNPEYKKGNGKPQYIRKRYEDGSVVREFQDLQPLENYIPPNGKKGDWNISLTDGTGQTKDMYNELSNLVSSARILDNAVWFYSQREMKESVDEIKSELTKSMNLSEDYINTLFFRTDSEAHLNVVEYLKINDPKNYKLYEIYNDSFATLISSEQIISNGGVYDFEAPVMRENHWPTLYHKENLKSMLDQLKPKLEEVIERLGKEGVELKPIWALREKEEYYDEENMIVNTKSIGTEKEWDLYNAVGQLNSVKSIQQNMDSYHIDLTNNTLIPLAKDNKHFKRLSSAYDIRNGRRDDGVFYDYLHNIMSSIQRNHMSAGLVKAIRLAQTSKRLPDSERQAIIDYSINLFKVPFFSTTVEGMFGISDESITKRINGMIGGYVRHYSPEIVTRFFSRMASFLTFKYLGGFMTPLTNLSGIFANVNDRGRRHTYRAIMRYMNSDSRDGIQKLIRLSGIAEFSDFFSKSMVNGIVGTQLEQDVSLELLRLMTKYHLDVKKFGQEKSEQMFIESAVDVLSNSQSYLKAEELEILDLSAIEGRVENVKLDAKQAVANKLVQFSINKEFEFKKVIGHKGLVKTYIARPGAKGYTQLIKALTLNGWATMSNTEKFIRGISFVLGIQRAYDAGLLNQKEKWWEYSNKDDIEKAIQIGKEFSYFSNYGMSTQAVGKFNYNGMGKLVGKFKYWSQQKAGRDIRIFKEAYRSVLETADIEKYDKRNGFENAFASSKAIGRLLKLALRPSVSLLGGKYQDRLRTTNPEVAALRTFLTTQVLMTMMWDMALGGPLRFLPTPKWASQFLYKSGLGNQVRNLTSDMASLMTLPLTMFLRAQLFGLRIEEEDDEDKARTAAYYARRIPFMGYVPTAMFESMLGVLLVASEEAEAGSKRIVNSVGGTWIGAGTLPVIAPSVRYLQEQALSSALDN